MTARTTLGVAKYPLTSVVSIIFFGALSTAQILDIGDKTVIVTNGVVVQYYFIAQSGRIYFSGHRVDQGPDAHSKWGSEFEIGKTRDFETRVFPLTGPAITCQEKTNATLSGQILELSTVSKVCGGKP